MKGLDPSHEADGLKPHTLLTSKISGFFCKKNLWGEGFKKIRLPWFHVEETPIGVLKCLHSCGLSPSAWGRGACVTPVRVAAKETNRALE